MWPGAMKLSSASQADAAIGQRMLMEGRISSDTVAESLESLDEAASDLLSVVFIEVVGAEVDILAVVLE